MNEPSEIFASLKKQRLLPPVQQDADQFNENIAHCLQSLHKNAS